MVPSASPAETGRSGATDPDVLRRRARTWLEVDPHEGDRAVVTGWLAADDREALAEAFGRPPLRFGTAGLRAPMGPGPSAMNQVVARAASRGLAELVGPGATVVVAHDARHRSATLALDTARVVATTGRAVLLADPVPTPVLAWAVRHLGAAAGVMITASHNPAEDNGYKVYGADGAQLLAPDDARVAAHVARWDEPVALAEPDAVEQAGDELLAAYVAAAADLVGRDGARSVRVVYTPLHGVANAAFTATAEATGFGDVHVVAEQVAPDPDFPTVRYPNPEEAGTLDLAAGLAGTVGADVVLANDPDGDRLGVLVPDGAGGWPALTGDQIGVLLADHLLRRTSGPDRLVVRTFVSSTLLSRLAEHHGVHHLEVATGFKWVAHAALAHPEWRLVFGYEESLGYCVGDLVNDKDGITAALVFAELVAELAAEGRTVSDRWEELARRFGLHHSANRSLRYPPGSAGAAARDAAMARLRHEPPASLAGRERRAVVDHLGAATPGERAAAGDERAWAADALALDFGDLRVVVRPSGTEPKLKLYVELVEPVPDGADGYRRATVAADATLDAAHAELADLLTAGNGAG